MTGTATQTISSHKSSRRQRKCHQRNQSSSTRRQRDGVLVSKSLSSRSNKNNNNNSHSNKQTPIKSTSSNEKSLFSREWIRNSKTILTHKCKQHANNNKNNNKDKNNNQLNHLATDRNNSNTQFKDNNIKTSSKMNVVVLSDDNIHGNNQMSYCSYKCNSDGNSPHTKSMKIYYQPQTRTPATFRRHILETKSSVQNHNNNNTNNNDDGNSAGNIFMLYMVVEPPLAAAATGRKSTNIATATDPTDAHATTTTALSTTVMRI
ncbi:probable serine/threonine-protein kinase fhkE [Rhagoletis pomonella]|uniref:probable serine/threonine-protein kinase fhkE n=1 Tax=Rhagoletis pomonella TaxID=28610 RepID=UPI00178427A4|nr:probable serine/threonine-protein kinase fhkE [Rhagoletis pomonella]